MKVIQDNRGVEIALTSSQDQSGIAAKLWRNCLEQTTEQQQERSLITTDRQKNQLQHNVTGRESSGDTRGKAGYTRMAAEVLEGYLSSQLDHPQKCGL